MNILNIPVTEARLAQWREWLAPARQPFFLTAEQARAFSSVPRAEANLTPEERDTCTVWAISPDAERVVWLSRAEWNTLPPAQQRDLLRAQVQHGRGNVPLGRAFRDLLPDLPAGRFLWQPEQLTPEILARLVEKEGQPSQHADVPQAVWDTARSVLTRARETAGTWPDGSAGNCFGTVMGAAGVPGAENQWMLREPFEDFLQRRTRKGGDDEQPGTVLVWRNRAGQVEHAAVTLGGGYALHKPSQTWWTPRVVLPTRELIRGWRTPGQRLGRYKLLRAGEG